jgi:hypothetical protein
MYDVELQEKEWEFFNNPTTHSFEELDKWLNELNGITKY